MDNNEVSKKEKPRRRVLCSFYSSTHAKLQVLSGIVALRKVELENKQGPEEVNLIFFKSETDKAPFEELVHKLEKNQILHCKILHLKPFRLEFTAEVKVIKVEMNELGIILLPTDIISTIAFCPEYLIKKQ